MRKFFLAVALALVVIGSLSPLNAEAQWRRRSREYYSYPNYEYTYSAPTYSYYYAPDSTAYSAPAAIPYAAPAVTSYYTDPAYSPYTYPAVGTYYSGPEYYSRSRYGRYWRR